MLLTSDQIAFLTNPAVQATEAASALYAGEVQQYVGLAGASSGHGHQRRVARSLNRRGFPGTRWLPHQCTLPLEAALYRGSYQTLASQEGNFPVFEGTSLYSLRLDHNVSNQSTA